MKKAYSTPELISAVLSKEDVLSSSGGGSPTEPTSQVTTKKYEKENRYVQSSIFFENFLF